MLVIPTFQSPLTPTSGQTTVTNSDELIGVLVSAPKPVSPIARVLIPSSGIGKSVWVKPASRDVVQEFGLLPNLNRASPEVEIATGDMRPPIQSPTISNQKNNRKRDYEVFGDTHETEVPAAKRQRHADADIPGLAVHNPAPLEALNVLGSDQQVTLSVTENEWNNFQKFRTERYEAFWQVPNNNKPKFVSDFKRVCHAMMEPLLIASQFTLFDGMLKEGSKTFEIMKRQLSMNEANRLGNFFDGLEGEALRQFVNYQLMSQSWSLHKRQEEIMRQQQLAMPMVPPVVEMSSVHFGSLPISARPTFPISSITLPTSTQTKTTSTSTTIQAASTTTTLSSFITDLQATTPINPEAATALPYASTTTGRGNSATTKTAKNKIQIIHEDLLPPPLKLPSTAHAKKLLEALPSDQKKINLVSAKSIKKELSRYKYAESQLKEMTSFVCSLVEIVSHGELLQLAPELDSIINKFLKKYLEIFRVTTRSGNVDNQKNENSMNGHLLNLLPNNPQFARKLGLNINNFPQVKRLGLAIKFNRVLKLMKIRDDITAEDFKKQIHEVIARGRKTKVKKNINFQETPAEHTNATASNSFQKIGSDEGSYSDVSGE